MQNKTYLCVLRSEEGGCESPSSPSEMEQQFARYQAWQQRFSANILDMGSKLGSVGSVVRQHGVTDGPFIELKEVIGGVMTLTAGNIEEAVNVIQNSPMVENARVSIEIREMFSS